jgi:hypothetical protein
MMNDSWDLSIVCVGELEDFDPMMKELCSDPDYQRDMDLRKKEATEYQLENS